MLKPSPPVACLRSTTVLCFKKWEFLIGKGDIGNSQRVFCSNAALIAVEVSSSQEHLHLLGIRFHWYKSRPASVWSMRLWSASGRRRRYCWCPHCTAKQSQILSVGVEKSIDILPSRPIMYTMNSLIFFFSKCHR